jgi:hypothetical protein
MLFGADPGPDPVAFLVIIFWLAPTFLLLNHMIIEMDESENCMEKHRLFVEVMERYLPMVEDQDRAPGATLTAGSGPSKVPSDPSRVDAGEGDSHQITLPWRRMAADLGWTVEQVQTHAFLYYTALCEDRMDRKRKRRSRQQGGPQSEGRAEGNPKQAKNRNVQGERARFTAAAFASSLPASVEKSSYHDVSFKTELPAEYLKTLGRKGVVEEKSSMHSSLEGRRQLPQFQDPSSDANASDEFGKVTKNGSGSDDGGRVVDSLLLRPHQVCALTPSDSRCYPSGSPGEN